jgi:hypothetical protein
MDIFAIWIDGSKSQKFSKNEKKIVGRIPLKWAKWKGPSNYLSEFFILIFSFSSWFLDYFLSFILVKFCFDGCSVELFSIGLFKFKTMQVNTVDAA